MSRDNEDFWSKQLSKHTSTFTSSTDAMAYDAAVAVTDTARTGGTTTVHAKHVELEYQCPYPKDSGFGMALDAVCKEQEETGGALPQSQKREIFRSRLGGWMSDAAVDGIIGRDKRIKTRKRGERGKATR
jgi:hypothetical protein